MPGTPIAKSASLFSANSFTCFGVITCSASDLRSSGRIAGSCIPISSPFTRSVGGRPTLRCRSEAFCWIICCRIALKLNVVPAGGWSGGFTRPDVAIAPMEGRSLWRSAIGVDAEEDLSVLHRMRVGGDELAHHAVELRLDLVHDLHRLDDAE